MFQIHLCAFGRFAAWYALQHVVHWPGIWIRLPVARGPWLLTILGPDELGRRARGKRTEGSLWLTLYSLHCCKLPLKVYIVFFHHCACVDIIKSFLQAEKWSNSPTKLWATAGAAIVQTYSSTWVCFWYSSMFILFLPLNLLVLGEGSCSQY